MSWDSEWGLGKLLGEWAFEREISGKGTMTGRARFEAVSEDRALYREAGELLLEGGSRLHGEQRYFYERTEGGFAIYFHESGELFQRMRFEPCEDGTWEAEAEHLCKADAYVSSYRFGRGENFEVRHEVRGPKKDFTIRTVYFRDESARR